MKNQLAKTLFGLVIFLFSVALAYFTASYLRDNKLFDYWGAIAIFACAYVVVGIVISSIFSISLGFLFAADVLILQLLLEYYGRWANSLKLSVIGIILVILYTVASLSLKDKPEVPSNLPPTPAVPH
jgi:hypothetical protein